MKELATDPREFSCMDDSPENNGWGYNWPDPREETIDADFEVIDDENNSDEERED